MSNEAHLESLKASRKHFEKTISCFRPQDAEYSPSEGMFSVAQHIAHAAQTVEWFLEGAFRPQGMNMDFEELTGEILLVKEMEDALAWWNSAMDEALVSIGNTAPEAWNEPIRGELMGGAPRFTIFPGITDHTAHHRGSLAVYARMLGLEPPMPYGD